MKKARVKELLDQVRSIKAEIEADVAPEPRTNLQAERLSMATGWLAYAAGSLTAVLEASDDA